MNEKPIELMNSDELNAHIAKLESQPFVAALQDLQPHGQARDLYAMGFAAGQQAFTSYVKRTKNREVVQCGTWAVVSSAFSVAATVMIMIQMFPMMERLGEKRMAEALDTEGSVQRPNARTDIAPKVVPEIAPQIAKAPTELDIDLEGTLAELGRRSGVEGTTTPTGLLDAKPTIARESLRYVAQRRAWISELPQDLQ